MAWHTESIWVTRWCCEKYLIYRTACRGDRNVLTQGVDKTSLSSLSLLSQCLSGDRVSRGINTLCQPASPLKIRVFNSLLILRQASLRRPAFPVSVLPFSNLSRLVFQERFLLWYRSKQAFLAISSRNIVLRFRPYHRYLLSFSSTHRLHRLHLRPIC